MTGKNGIVGLSTRCARLVACGIFAALSLSVGVQHAMAQFTLSTETRQLLANVSIGDSDESDAAGLYVNTVSDFGDPSDMTGDSITTTASATQDSSIDTTGFSGTGSATASAEVSGVIQDSTGSNANSSFDVTFTVPVPTLIQLTGELDASGDATSSASFDGYTASADGTTTTAPLSFSETLQPGHTYELTLSGGSLVGASIETVDGDEGPNDAADSGTGSFSFSFSGNAVVPEPATAAIFLMGLPMMMGWRRKLAD